MGWVTLILISKRVPNDNSEIAIISVSVQFSIPFGHL